MDLAYSASSAPTRTPTPLSLTNNPYPPIHHPLPTHPHPLLPPNHYQSYHNPDPYSLPDRYPRHPSSLSSLPNSLHHDLNRYSSPAHFSPSFSSSLSYTDDPRHSLPPFDASFGQHPGYLYRDSSGDTPRKARSLAVSDRQSGLLALHAHRESHPQGPTSHIQTEPHPLLPSDSNDIDLSYSIYPEQSHGSSRASIGQKHHPPSSIPMSNNLGLSRPSLNSAFDNQSSLPPPINETSPDPNSDSDSGTSMAALQSMAAGGSEPPHPPASSSATSSAPPIRKKKKSKMHPCQICGKGFPRPSGLSTHMNTHNNARPYICEYPGCQRRFGVRSNAKRHLRTHGVIPQSANTAGQTPYHVGFSPPVVNQPNASAYELAPSNNYRIRWMPPSLTTRTNASRLRQVSEQEAISDDSNDEDDAVGTSQLGSRGGSRRAESLLSIPLQPAIPSPCRAPEPCACSRCLSGASSSQYSPEPDDPSFEERNSFAPAGSYPYHPSQFHGLPGPAAHPSRSCATN